MKHASCIFRLKSKWWFLILSWVLPLGLVGLGLINQGPIAVDDGGAKFSLPQRNKNELRDFRLVHYDQTVDFRTNFSIGFERLQAQNAPLGLFRTALHKIVTIEKLQVCRYEYDDSVNTLNNEAGRSGPEDRLFSMPPEQGLWANYQSAIDKISEKLQNKYLRLELPDVSNTSQVQIKQFDYRLYHEGKKVLAVKSKRAYVSYRRPETITLRGHVIVSANEMTLESNRVEWDIAEQRFTAPGKYLLTHNQRKTSGQEACLDASLELINETFHVNNVEQNRKYK